MSQLKTREKPGSLSGLTSMISLEISKWFGENRWLIQSGIWLLLINGLMSLGLVIAPIQGAETPIARDGIVMFAELLFSVGPIGVIILTQGDIINERQNGSMEWMLTAPLSRASVVLGKFIINSLFIISIAVALQGAFGYVLITRFAEGTIKVAPFIASLGVHGVHLIFWVGFTLMLGAFMEKRAMILGASIGLLLLQGLIGTTLSRLHPVFQEVLPGVLQRTALQVATGEALKSYIPLAATFFWIIISLGLAIWRFNQIEF